MKDGLTNPHSCLTVHSLPTTPFKTYPKLEVVGGRRSIIVLIGCTEKVQNVEYPGITHGKSE